MQSSTDSTRFYSFLGEANALGGYLEEPFKKVIPTHLPVSLPAVGGFSTARSDRFIFEEIVSFESAYTRISGQEHPDGSVSILATAVVEGLDLLEVVDAERVVAQLSLWFPGDGGDFRVSTAGSQFVGLRVAGRPTCLTYNAQLNSLASDDEGRARGFTIADAIEQGRSQAASIIRDCAETHAAQWAEKRFGWMTTAEPRKGYLCSLLDGFEGADPPTCGHVVEIPGFGRFIFGELLITPTSAQLVSIRAELGCPVSGKITINGGGGGGVHN